MILLTTSFEEKLILKKIVHYFADKSLREHRRKTDLAHEKYEQEKDAVEFRLNEKQSKLKDALALNVEQAEKRLTEHVDTLNKVCNTATSLQPKLMTLQSLMYDAFDSWFVVKRKRVNIIVISNKYEKIEAEISYYKECVRAFDVAVEMKEKRLWNERTRKFQTQVDNQHVHNARDYVQHWAKAQDDDVKRQKRKITSALELAKNNLIRLRSELSGLRAELRTVNNSLNNIRKSVASQYKLVMDEWYDLKDTLTIERGDLEDVIAEQKEWKEVKSEIHDEKKEAEEGFQLYKGRIEQARREDDYDDFDSYKKKKSHYHSKRVACYEKLDDVKEELSALNEQFNDIRAWQNHLYAISPRHIVESFYKHLLTHMPDEAPEVYFDSVRVKTKTTASLIDAGFSMIEAQRASRQQRAHA